ncbi:hypothetical protein GCM10010401_22650 [Rarobacter faecitabidus]|uniref:Twitching motility protein PilT n=1 Tax=Rarobacter faecitabidus TaxID=13243 RepID=A0A542ZVS4_RARFA|nr:PilT/PilU family type 4a pilus ATPase [Rarobacter faecitabidus]TQL64467.1 twitching motility protein PilT [Rarobacter faecitabidus]
MSENQDTGGGPDFSWALGPKDVPPVNKVPARLQQNGTVPGSAGGIPPGSGQPAPGSGAGGGRPLVGQPLRTAHGQGAPGAAPGGSPIPPSQRTAAPAGGQARGYQPAGGQGPLNSPSQPAGASAQQSPRASASGAPAAGTWQPAPGRDTSPAANPPIAADVPVPQAVAPGTFTPTGAAPGFPGQAAFTPEPTAPAPTKTAVPAGPAPTAKRAPAGSGAGRVGLSQDLRDGDVSLDALLREVAAVGASDLHLTKNSPPMVRRDGGLKPIEGQAPLDGDSLRRSVYQILTQKQREKFEEELELDLAYQVPGGARFRVNLYQQRDSLGAAFRIIPTEIKPLESLGVPAVVGSFASIPRGLVLVTGPTGSGKSTTLASIIDLANRNRPDHIMTVEDPIEFLHEHKRSIVNQREVGEDTRSFANALKHVLRQDPDIILVGEMRDLETISVALTAAETGHLVFATLHTQDAAQTIDRVIDVFPPSQQDQIRVQLAATIQGVVCQTLCKRADGPGRVVATEIMVATPAIRNLIREGKTHQIYSAMQAGAGDGMHSMDQHLADLLKQGVISYETGLEKCQNVADFNRLTGRGGSTVGAGIANMGMGGNLEGGSTY